MSDVQIVVHPLTLLPAAGNLRAFAWITIGDRIEIHGIRIIQQDGQRAYVALPQSEHTTAGGQKKYYPLIKFVGASAHVDDAIKKAVLEAWMAQPK